MLRNTMPDNLLTLFYVVEGGSVSNAFKVKVESTMTVYAFKSLIKVEQTPTFVDSTVDELTLWLATISNKGSTITLDALNDKTELNNPMERLSNLFSDSSDDNPCIIVQRPRLPPGKADLRVTTCSYHVD